MLRFFLFLCFANLYATMPYIGMVRGIEWLDIKSNGYDERLVSFLISNEFNNEDFNLQIRLVNGCVLKGSRNSSNLSLKSLKLRLISGGKEVEIWNASQGTCESKQPFAVNINSEFGDATNYQMELVGSWDGKGANMLSGTFWETVVFVITPK